MAVTRKLQNCRMSHGELTRWSWTRNNTGQFLTSPYAKPQIFCKFVVLKYMKWKFYHSKNKSWGLSTLNVHPPNLDPIHPTHFQMWFWSRMIWTTQWRIVRWHGRHACMCRLHRQWALLWAIQCVPRNCSSRDDGWLEYRSDESTIVNCTEVWALEVNVHAWTRSTQCSVNMYDVH